MDSSTSAYRLAALLTAQRCGPKPIRGGGGQTCIWSGQRQVEDEGWVVGLVVDGAGRRVSEGGDAIGRGPVALVLGLGLGLGLGSRHESWLRSPCEREQAGL